MAKKKDDDQKEDVVKKGPDKNKEKKNRELYRKPASEKTTTQDTRYDTGVSKTKTYSEKKYFIGGKGCKPVIKRKLVGIKTTGGVKKGVQNK